MKEAADLFDAILSEVQEVDQRERDQPHEA